MFKPQMNLIGLRQFIPIYLFKVHWVCNDYYNEHDIIEYMFTFLSRCLSNRVRASVSPPGHTADDSPSVSKPEATYTDSKSHPQQTHAHICKVKEHGCFTELLQWRYAELVIVVFADGCCTFTHDFTRDGLSWYFHRIHSADDRLKSFIGERRLSSV